MRHLPRRAPGEGQRHDPLRSNTARHQPRDSGNQRGGLAGSGAGQDPQLLALEGRGRPLLVIQSIQRWEHTFDYRVCTPL